MYQDHTIINRSLTIFERQESIKFDNMGNKIPIKLNNMGNKMPIKLNNMGISLPI